MENKDYYELLGVSTDASDQQVKEAYRRKAFEYHPDRNQGNPEASSKMQALNEAYAVLSDHGKRQQYDALRRQYGGSAHRHFRQSYSEQDLFRNSDIQQIFEEMARAFGLRGFDEIFKDLQGKGYGSFEFRRPGMMGRGVFYGPGTRRRDRAGRAEPAGVLGNFAQKVLQKMTGLQFPKRGDDIGDVLVIAPEVASGGGKIPYYHRHRDKTLMVNVPASIKEGQQIRLAGMGHAGVGGAENGDLYLRVRIKQSLVTRLKRFLGFPS